MSPLIKSVVAVLALSASAAFAADPVYKSTMPDGRVIYGESPMQGAKKVAKGAAPPEQTGVVVATQQDTARANSIPPQQGGVTVIPEAPHYPVRPAQQGYLANPNGTRSGY